MSPARREAASGVERERSDESCVSGVSASPPGPGPGTVSHKQTRKRLQKGMT